MGPQLHRAAVVCGCVLGCGSLASLYQGGCRRESTAGRDSLSQEFIAGRSWWRFVAPCVASNSASLIELSRCLCAVLHHWLSAATPVCSCCRLCDGWLQTLVRCSRSSSLLVLVEVRFFPRTVLCSFLVVAALPSGLRCIAWLLCSSGVSQNCLLLS
ncbi:hypothetical protein Taro_007154 [Colocasia esculenta]|uniref:Secreted protein n=1 Tax=Colocasia esculenta TaxID=4460 RepID=A0A843TZH7_COLES|nr:hypothetical protein [Colocasia esculenta]